VCVYNQHNVPPDGARTKGFHEHGGSAQFMTNPPSQSSMIVLFTPSVAWVPLHINVLTNISI